MTNSMASARLWNHYRDEVDNVNDNALNVKFLKYSKT